MIPTERFKVNTKPLSSHLVGVGSYGLENFYQ